MNILAKTFETYLEVNTKLLSQKKFLETSKEKSLNGIFGGDMFTHSIEIISQR